MSLPAREVADIFRDHGPAWHKANAGHVSLVQLKVKVMSAIDPLGLWLVAMSAHAVPNPCTSRMGQARFAPPVRCGSKTATTLRLVSSRPFLDIGATRRTRLSGL